MSENLLLVHFGELGTKGENKRLFISQLFRNVKHSLAVFPTLTFERTRDRIVVGLHEEDESEVLAALSDVSGIQRISLAEACESTLESIEKKALELIEKEEGKSFKAVIRRADKGFPLDSYHLACAIGDYVLDRTDLHVDVHNPDIALHVEVRSEGSYLYAHSYPGAGGYPLGMNGKVLLLLSGGIDSPVAAYLLLRRGIRIECLHFAAPPYTSAAVIDKLKDILSVLNHYQEEIKLDIVPFTKLQEAIYAHVPEPYCITIMRRMMMRIAERVAKKGRCLALATGESIGQVASQTLESIGTINAVTSFPIIRPCATLDKLDIIKVAEKIGTFDISIRPYEDCCTIFAPKRPKTKPRLGEAEHFEAGFDFSPLVDECVAGVTSILYKNGSDKFNLE